MIDLVYTVSFPPNKAWNLDITPPMYNPLGGIARLCKHLLNRIPF